MSWIKRQISKGHEIFVPENLEKMIDGTYCVARSSWEKKFMQWLDHNPMVIQWGSECVKIPYFDPVSKKTRHYYPDFLVKVIDKEQNESIYLIEIKPLKETAKPKPSSGRKKLSSKLYEQQTYMRNFSKWKSAHAFCIKRGWNFRLVTEKELFR